MTHDDVRALAAEYALDLLDAGNRAAVDQHLAACASCRAYAADEARVLEGLGRSVPQVAPPVALRDRVLAASRGTQDRPAVIPPVAIGRPSATGRLMPWLIAASVLLMAAFGAWQILSTRERAREAERAEQARAMAVVAAADLVRFDLTGSGVPARARALWSHRHGMVFSAEGLAALPEGRTYQLWAISDGVPISAGVFERAPDGRARVVTPTPESLTRVDAVAVTVEPSGGVTAPSTAPILVGAASPSQ